MHLNAFLNMTTLVQVFPSLYDPPTPAPQTASVVGDRSNTEGEKNRRSKLGDGDTVQKSPTFVEHHRDDDKIRTSAACFHLSPVDVLRRGSHGKGNRSTANHEERCYLSIAPYRVVHFLLLREEKSNVPALLSVIPQIFGVVARSLIREVLAGKQLISCSSLDLRNYTTQHNTLHYDIVAQVMEHSSILATLESMFVFHDIFVTKINENAKASKSAS